MTKHDAATGGRATANRARPAQSESETSSSLLQRDDAQAPDDRGEVARASTPQHKPEPTVSIQVVYGLVEAAHKIAGVPRLQLLRAAQLQPEQIRGADARIPRSVVLRLCDHALELSRDPALGLHWSERVSEGSFVPISSIIPQAQTLRHAFAAAAQFNRLLSDEASYQLIEQDKSAILRRVEVFGASPRVERFTAEMMVAGIFRIISHFGVEARAVRVNFQYVAPPYAHEYERVFKQRPHFGEPFTGVVFDRALLDFPAPQRDPEVHDALAALAERRLWRITEQTPYALRVRETLLLRWQSDKSQAMHQVARSLGLSARTLRRRLADEGVSYNAVLGEALATVAKNLLHDRRRTIEDVASEMGFSDASTFHRAFKRWTGLTPSSYRAAR